MYKSIMLVLLVGFLAVAMFWGAAFGSGKEPVLCTAGTSSINAKGETTTIWYPKGCYHKI